MNFFILGCNGMAGHIISLYLKEQGHSVLGFARTKSRYVDSVVGDAFDKELLIKLIAENKFDVIVNCIGMLNQFAEQDKASASFLNSYLPHFLAEITADSETQIIHMSTDCVFSGKDGSYTEDSFCDGETFYDRSKALGELVDSKNLTLRNSIVGPDINPKGIGLLNWFMQQNVEVNGFTKSIWTGQTTLQLAKTIEKAALEKAHGLYNAVPDHSISKYELVILFNHYFKGDSLKINPVEGILADKSLIRTNYEFDYIIPDYETMVVELAEWIKNHKDMYPHYNLSN
jgi:dTDP-4-dehydrorhamnose reductase